MSPSSTPTQEEERAWEGKYIRYATSSEVAAAAAKSLQSCLILCDPIHGSLLGSPVPRILQARTLEWVVISFSNAWKWKVKVKSLSCVQQRPHGLQPTRLLRPWDFPGKSTGVGCHCLLRLQKWCTTILLIFYWPELVTWSWLSCKRKPSPLSSCFLEANPHYGRDHRFIVLVPVGFMDEDIEIHIQQKLKQNSYSNPGVLLGGAFLQY